MGCNQWFKLKPSITGQINFSYTFRQLYCLLRIFGVIPFSVKRNESGDVIGYHVGIFNFVLIILSLLINILSTYYSISMWSDSVSSEIIKLAIIYNIMFLVFRQSSRSIDAIWNLCYRKRFIRLLQNFDKFDREVSCVKHFNIRRKIDSIHIHR